MLFYLATPPLAVRCVAFATRSRPELIGIIRGTLMCKANRRRPRFFQPHRCATCIGVEGKAGFEPTASRCATGVLPKAPLARILIGCLASYPPSHAPPSGEPNPHRPLAQLLSYVHRIAGAPVSHSKNDKQHKTSDNNKLVESHLISSYPHIYRAMAALLILPFTIFAPRYFLTVFLLL